MIAILFALFCLASAAQEQPSKAVLKEQFENLGKSILMKQGLLDQVKEKALISNDDYQSIAQAFFAQNGRSSADVTIIGGVLSLGVVGVESGNYQLNVSAVGGFSSGVRISVDEEGGLLKQQVDKKELRRLMKPMQQKLMQQHSQVSENEFDFLLLQESGTYVDAISNEGRLRLGVSGATSLGQKVYISEREN